MSDSQDEPALVRPTFVRGWMRQPQRVGLRRVIFRLHLWCGLVFGLYVLFISLTGSVLVYRNELYQAAVDRSSVSGMQLVSTLIDLHAELLSGPTGRWLNGVGAVAVLISALTGLIVWWPGIRRWRRSLMLRRGVGWKRLVWDLHSAIGIWSFAFIVVFAVSGLYLSTPETFHAWADRLVPRAGDGLEIRFVDRLLSWIAFSHFGRINGIGLPCEGPGLCDQATKAVWAVFGLAPAALIVSGSIMWRNRVLKRRQRH